MRREDPEDGGELMYVRCASCGKWMDVKPGAMSAVSHGLCSPCLQRELEQLNKDAPDPSTESPR